MNSTNAFVRAAALIAVVGLLALLLAPPTAARSFAAYQVTQEPTPRPTVPPVAYIELDPEEGVAGDETEVLVTGGFWQAGDTVRLYWDDPTIPELFLGEIVVLPDRTIQTTFLTPTNPLYATAGTHLVLAIAANGDQAQAEFTLIAPSPTPTRTFTPTPTRTPPVSPSATATATGTPTPSPTLRPITPMVTITPIPPTRQPTRRATATRPAASRTPTRVAGTATNTLTPSPTPGPGTPSATPPPSDTPSPTPEGEIAETGGGWGSLFLWGFVLAGLVVAFRLLRVRGLGEPR